MVVPGLAELKPMRVPALVSPTKGTVGNGVGVFDGVKVAVGVLVAVIVAVFVGEPVPPETVMLPSVSTSAGTPSLKTKLGWNCMFGSV